MNRKESIISTDVVGVHRSNLTFERQNNKDNTLFDFVETNPNPTIVVDLKTMDVVRVNGLYNEEFDNKEDNLNLHLLFDEDTIDYIKTKMSTYEKFSSYESYLKGCDYKSTPVLISGVKYDTNGKEYMIQSISYSNEIVMRQKRYTSEMYKLKFDNRKKEAMISNTSDATSIIDRRGNLIEVSSNIENIFGWKQSDVLGTNFLTRVHPDDVDRLKEMLSKYSKINNFCATDEFRYRCSDGSYKFIEFTAKVFTNDPVINGILVDFRDVTDRKNSEEKILKLSSCDSLTGLYNRGYFENYIYNLNLKDMLPISFMMIDVDGLKLTNDTFGHVEGDALLINTADILNKSIGQKGITARFGGDEFVVFLPNTSSSQAEELHKKISNLCNSSSYKISLHLSIGVSSHDSEEDINVDSLIMLADKAMYAHKLLQKESSSNSIILALEQMLIEKSNETKEHTSRVVSYANILGEALNLNTSEKYNLSLLASLHDIGKVAISESILNKKSGLNEEEWLEIKRHPEIGYNIVKSSPQLIHISQEILSCHERWDGQGYSRGLKKTKIPLLSRIVFLVNSYDVITSEIPYKQAVSKEEAVLELKRCSGKQFDPSLVDIFIDVLVGEQ